MRLRLALTVALLSFPLAAQNSVQPPNPHFRNTAPGVPYVGTKVCGACHSDIAARYSRTAMGRSMSVGDNPALAQAAIPFTIFDSQQSEYFEISRNGDALFQSQYALDREGHERFRQTWKIAYIMGSGENGIGFLIDRDGYLFEAPLSYYTRSRTWSFSPGYERHNYAFTRPVVVECTSCHSGRPRPLYGTRGRYQNPPFAELAVGCENCHGPGGLHVIERRAAVPLTGPVDTSIVNPAHLSGWLSDNICMRCHQGGDVRVLQPGKHEADFRPGTQLDSVLAIFKVPLNHSGTDPQNVLLEHYFSMSLSKCYRASNGRLRCVSCHDPHTKPDGTQVAVYFRDRCMACHASQPCKLSASERRRTEPADNCIACHMPKRPVATITHAALTEHRIIARPQEPFPEEAFRASASGLIQITAGQGNATAPASDITLFQAYATLVHSGHAEYRSRMSDVLGRLSRNSPNDPAVLSALAREAAAKGTPEASKTAIEDFTRAIQSGSTERDNFLMLAELYRRSGQNARAVDILRRGLQTNPYAPEIPESLAALYVELEDYRSARDMVRHGLNLFPGDVALHALDQKIQSAMPDEASGNHLQ